jgi:nucleotide sugar dehydrogenase
MKIGLIGAGRLGICFALLMAEAGYDVLASDTREDYIKDLQNFIIGDSEPDVQELLQRVEVNEHLEFTTDNKKVIRECETIFTLVATPSLDDGSYDVSAVWDVVNEIKEEMTSVANYTKSFVVGCTTNPGDCDKFKEELPESVEVYYNPEFIAQGSIIKDLRHADMVLVGGKENDLLEEIYNKIQEGHAFGGTLIYFMSTKAAEIVKIAINTYLTTKISYANTLGQVMISSGLGDEVQHALDAIGTDTRIGNKYMRFGFGFGGPCFPRDNKAFASFANKVGIEFNIGETTDNFNDAHAQFLKEYFISKNKNKLPFVFRSIAYKPGTDILTESQQYRLCVDLLDEGYKVYVIDDCVKGKCDDRILYGTPEEESFAVNL